MLKFCLFLDKFVFCEIIKIGNKIKIFFLSQKKSYIFITKFFEIRNYFMKGVKMSRKIYKVYFSSLFFSAIFFPIILNAQSVYVEK